MAICTSVDGETSPGEALDGRSVRLRLHFGWASVHRPLLVLYVLEHLHAVAMHRGQRGGGGT